MEKVKITQEQADAIEIGLSNNDWSKDGMLSIHAERYEKFTSSSWGHPYESINDLHIGKLARALYIGYEVEPEFKVGDWVKSRHGIGTGKITDIRLGYHTDFGMVAASDDIRHATPEEIATEKTRRWWKKHDRDVWEIRQHDVLTHKASGGHYVVLNPDGDFVTFYGLYSGKSLHNLRGQFLVKYFSQDRKDI